MSSESICKRCNRVHGVDGYSPLHRPVYGDLETLPTPEKPDPVPAFPFDPVLRQALMDKGVLMPEDILAAEKKIRVMTNQVAPGFRVMGGVTDD